MNEDVAAPAANTNMAISKKEEEKEVAAEAAAALAAVTTAATSAIGVVADSSNAAVTALLHNCYRLLIFTQTQAHTHAYGPVKPDKQTDVCTIVVAVVVVDVAVSGADAVAFVGK